MVREHVRRWDDDMAYALGAVAVFLVYFLAAFALTGCSGPRLVTKDAVLLRQGIALVRTGTTPKPELDDEDRAALGRAWKTLDEFLSRLEER